MSKHTGLCDINKTPIYIGDRLKSKWGYEVIVAQDKDGDFYGKLICLDNHSCKNIPYSLDSENGYIKIKGGNNETH